MITTSETILIDISEGGIWSGLNTDPVDAWITTDQKRLYITGHNLTDGFSISNSEKTITITSPEKMIDFVVHSILYTKEFVDENGVLKRSLMSAVPSGGSAGDVSLLGYGSLGSFVMSDTSNATSPTIGPLTDYSHIYEYNPGKEISKNYFISVEEVCEKPEEPPVPLPEDWEEPEICIPESGTFYISIYHDHDIDKKELKKLLLGERV